MKKYYQKRNFLVLLCLSIAIIAGFSSTPDSALTSPENKTLMPSQGIQGMSTNGTNIVLVHGAWADGSSWNKVIPILQNAGHNVIAVQLPEHSLADDVETVKRAIEHIGGPAILVGHSYGGAVITDAGYNNPNVTGLVYVAAFAPDEGQSLSNFVDLAKLPKDLLIFDSGGFVYINPAMFPGAFAHDIDPAEAAVMAIVQKPINQSVLGEKSGPPAWKQLPTWYQISEGDHMIPPDAERLFAKQMNATTLSINSSHASPVSHPEEIAQLILNATKGSSTQATTNQ
jgi:pimeloyl-ACP methyl ester carboxylesterase